MKKKMKLKWPKTISWCIHFSSSWVFPNSMLMNCLDTIYVWCASRNMKWHVRSKQIALLWYIFTQTYLWYTIYIHIYINISILHIYIYWHSGQPRIIMHAMKFLKHMILCIRKILQTYFLVSYNKFGINNQNCYWFTYQKY